MRLKQCLLCPYSDRLRAAVQYVTMGQQATYPPQPSRYPSLALRQLLMEKSRYALVKFAMKR